MLNQYGYTVWAGKNSFGAVINGFMISAFKSLYDGKWKVTAKPNFWRKHKVKINACI